MKTSSIKSRELQKRRTLLEEGRVQGLSQGLDSFSLERVAFNTGISKRTLYKYFGSRDGFIAVLIAFDGDAWREWFFDAIREQADAAEKRLLVFFEILASWTTSSDFQGCLFAQALCGSATYSEVIVHIAQEQMDYVHKFIQEHAQKAGVRNPLQFANYLLPPTMLLLSGAGSHVAKNPGQQLTALAQTLLQNNLPTNNL